MRIVRSWSVVALATLAIAGSGAPPALGASPSPPVPGASPSPVLKVIPTEFQDGYWLGSYHEVPGLDNAAGDRIALDVSPYTLSIQADTGRPNLLSLAQVATDGRLQLRTVIEGTGCEPGDTGLYRWSLSDGPRSPLTQLTIDPGTDDCAVRAATIPGTFVTSGCDIPNTWCLNELPAGTYASAFFEPRGPGGDAYKVRLGALTYTVPEGWAHAGDSPQGGYELMPEAAFKQKIGDPGSWPDAIRLWSRPTALSTDSMCSPKADPAVGRSVDALVAWIGSHPGLVVRDQQPVTIGGYSGQMLDLDVAPTWTATCPDWEADAGPFVPLFTEGGWLKADGTGGDNAYWWGPGGFPGLTSDPERLILLDLDGDTLAITIDSNVPDGQEALVETAMPIVETFEFPK